MEWFSIGFIASVIFFELGIGKPQKRCDILHYEQCCTPSIYNKCFHKCHHWASLNCFQDRLHRDQAADLVDTELSSPPTLAEHKIDENAVFGDLEEVYDVDEMVRRVTHKSRN
ncbi:unnamed protein product [Gongylonema pulchrum]|uniref:Secreted protein n=1 Tax=Gongylonema pulchrum TaxID=637853 RepID=A0A183CXR7_9BILA|nr:unnamed protein product [Gongylonema pulchrum]